MTLKSSHRLSTQGCLRYHRAQVFVCPTCAASYPDAGFCGGDGTKLSAIKDDMMLGTTVGAYRIAALVGVGGWGRVYKGVHPDIGSRVAIKVLSRDFTSNPELIKRFFNEARAVNLIRHENIVNIIDLSQLPDKRPYIVMEYLDGLSLSKHIANKGRLGISETCRICAETLDALAVAHDKGIIHRDLKPDNLFITPEGRAKVLDFGIAKLREDDAPDSARTRAGSLIGTPHFMSPEQALARPVDPRSDIYSIGVILFQCLTGQFPFHADSVLELARAHVERPPVSPRSIRPDIPAELDALVLRALAKDPADRWQDAATLSMALQRIGQQHPGQRTRSLAVESGGEHLPTGIPPTQIADPQGSAPLVTPSSPPSNLSAAEPAKVGSSSAKRVPLLLAGLFLFLGLGLTFFLLQSGKDDKSGSQADRRTSKGDETKGQSQGDELSTGGTTPDTPPVTNPVTNPVTQPPPTAPEVSSKPIIVPEPSAACANPEDHCLPDDKLYFTSLRPWSQGSEAVHIADQLTKPDGAGEAKFRIRTTNKEIVTHSFHKTRKAQRADLVAGRMAVYFIDRSEAGLRHPPTSTTAASTQRWHVARIVSIDGLLSGSYVLVSGGHKVDAGAVRVVLSDKGDTAVEQGPVDEHLLRANHWIITRAPLNDTYQEASIGLPIEAPSSATKGEGHFILTASGNQLWTANAWRTRVAKAKDLTLGTRVFVFKDNFAEVYKGPKGRTEALTRRWWTGLITDDSMAFKGQVQVGGSYLVDAKAVRVIADKNTGLGAPKRQPE